ADELLDGAAVPLEGGAHLVEVAGHQAPERLRVEPLTERRRPDHVGEEDRDGLPHLVRRRRAIAERRRAGVAETGVVGVLPPAAWASDHGPSLGRPRPLWKKKHSLERCLKEAPLAVPR